MIQNLLIDFGGVLIDLDRQRCIKKFEALGLTDIESALGLCDKQDFLQAYETGQITSAQFRDEIRRRTSRPVTDAEIDEAWNSFLVTIPDYKLDLLLKLRDRYMVYLLSNTNEIHWLWSCQNVFRYKSFHVEDFFERIFLSYEMKLAKPDIRIFQRVIEVTDIQPEQTLFIDDADINCRTAETLGIQTYTPKTQEDWGKSLGFRH